MASVSAVKEWVGGPDSNQTPSETHSMHTSEATIGQDKTQKQNLSSEQNKRQHVFFKRAGGLVLVL